MSDERVREIIRRFPENGVKLLLENGDNIRDLLVLARADVVEQIDFRRLQVSGTTFVQHDYRNLEADLVLTAPLRMKGRERQILLYILIEHQSEPDELMPLRLLTYLDGVFNKQVRDWKTAHGTTRGIRLQPVLPVVFYTGSRRWEDVGSLTDLIEEGARFAAVTPRLTPLFLNLGGTEPERLEAEGGWFGQLLRVVRAGRADEREFRGVLREVVGRLEEMPPEQRERWRELMSYLDAFVYHTRSRPEVAPLLQVITTSLRSEDNRREVEAMQKTMAEVHKDLGNLEGKRETLLFQLRERFGEIPAEIVATVETTASLEPLQQWLKRVVKVQTLEEVGIAPTSE